jgi:cobalamin-dependent methionine synthase I
MGTQVSSTNKTDRHDITEILLKVALNTINHPVQTIFIDNNIEHIITFCRWTLSNNQSINQSIFTFFNAIN